MSVSRTRSRGGIRIGLLVSTVVVLTAACGSIEVVTGDAGGGSGGMPGGGTGGVHGGGSGGTPGTGGIISGGTGGTNRGSGGMIGGGTGGMGSGGTGAGGSGPTCTQIQKAFVAALADAKMCVAGASGYCGVVTSDKLECGCPTHVNDTKNIDPIRTQWAQSGCASGVCPQIACIAYKSAICAVPSGGTSPVCQDQTTLPTP
jgi:hypothetical protein